MGRLAGRFRRFPLLLKFLDAREMLSVQVHPSDAHSGPDTAGRDRKDRSMGRAGGGSRKPYLRGPEAGYHGGHSAAGAGQRDGGGAPRMLHAEARRCASSYRRGRSILWAALVVFEVQQNSDVTFRLYDWDHVDAKTGQPRALQVDQALACIDFGEYASRSGGARGGGATPVEREKLFDCEPFRLWRLRGQSPFTVGAAGVPRVLVCIEGKGQVEHDGATYQPERATCCCCPRLSGRALFSRRAQ